MIPLSVSGEIEFEARNVQFLSQLPLTSFPETQTSANDIWHYVSASGQEYAIIGLGRGVGFVRVTDPGRPAVVGYVSGQGPSAISRDIAVYDHYAYLVSGDGVGLQIADLGAIDDDLVQLVKTSDLGAGFTEAHNVYVNTTSGYLYLAIPNIAGGLGLVAVDLNVNPAEPAIAGIWHDAEPNVRCHDFFVTSYDEGPNVGREIAFCLAEDDGLRIVDVTDKDAMFLLAKLNYPDTSYTHQAWLTEDGRLLLIGDELDEAVDSLTDPALTYVVNVEDLSRPEFLGSFSNGVPARDHNLMIRDDFVFEANYSSGLRVFTLCDVNSVGDIREVGFFDTHPEINDTSFVGAWGVDSQLPSGNVLVSDRQRGLFVLDPTEALTSDRDSDGILDACEHGAVLADANHSGRVDGFDLALLGQWFGGQEADPDFEHAVDFDGNGQIDGADLSILAANFGQSVM